MRRRVSSLCVMAVTLLAASSCVSRREAAPTPFPSLEPIADFMARLTPRPSVSPSPSPSASVIPGGSPVANSDAASAKKSVAPQGASASRLSCPSGRVTADIEDVQASEAGDPYHNGDRRWNVSASGVVSNGASAAVRSAHLVVTVHGSNGRAGTADVTVGQTIGSGASVPWSTSFQYRGTSKPSGDQSSVAVAGWTWAASNQSGCPT